MRFSVISLRCVVFAALLCAAPATSAQFPSLWPNSKQADADQGPTPENTDSEDPSLLDSPFFKVGWPKVEMPKINWKPGFGSGAADPTASGGQNPVSRALDSVANESRKAAGKVRNAWGSTVSALTPGGGSRQTASNDQPGFWSRLFRQEEPSRPRTTTEFLAQDRVGTQR